MKSLSVAAVLLCSLGMTAAAGAATQHNHEQHADHATTAARAPAQLWMPDAPLREGMRRASVAVDALRHYEMGHMSAPMAADRAGDVEDAVVYMLANCKLTAEPDAALHGILVPLLSAAQALQSDPQNLKPIAEMRAALAHYPQYFNDPGWDKSAPSAHVMHDEP